MTNYKPGDIVLVEFSFASGEQTKRRPALVIFDAGDADVVVARVTSQSRLDEFDVELEEWHGAGLMLSSIVRLHKLATLEKKLVTRRLGSLQPADHQRIASALGKILANW